MSVVSRLDSAMRGFSSKSRMSLGASPKLSTGSSNGARKSVSGRVRRGSKVDARLAAAFSPEELAGRAGDITLTPLPKSVYHKVNCRKGQSVAHVGVRLGYAESQGVRQTMEDTISVIPKLKGPDTFYCGVFDGHGGDTVSRELKARLHKMISKNKHFAQDPELAIRRGCLALDRRMLHFAATYITESDALVEKGLTAKSLLRTKNQGLYQGSLLDQYRNAGSTAVVALLRTHGSGRMKRLYLIVGWAGDSRCVLSRGGKALALTHDHKASRDDETARVRASGGTVDRKGRLYGDLAVSRAFGDLRHKGRELAEIVGRGPDAKAGDDADAEYGASGTLVACPETTAIQIQPEDEFYVMASDGVFDVMSNEHVVNFCRFKFYEHGDASRVANDLVEKALSMGSVDNCSAVVVSLMKAKGK